MRSHRRLAVAAAVVVLATAAAAVAWASGDDAPRDDGALVLEAHGPGGTTYQVRFRVRGEAVCARLTVRGRHGTSGSARCADEGARGLSGIQHALCRDRATVVYGSAPSGDADVTVAPRGTVSQRLIGGRTAFLTVVGGVNDGAEVRSSTGAAGHRRVAVDPLTVACGAQAGIEDPTDTFEPFD